MAAVAHSPAFAKKVGIKKSVGAEFIAADKGKKFKEGGMMDKKDLAQDKMLIKKAMKQHDAQEHKGGKGTSLKLKKGGGMAKSKKYVSGGKVSQLAKANGAAVCGKTKGKNI